MSDQTMVLGNKPFRPFLPWKSMSMTLSRDTTRVRQKRLLTPIRAEMGRLALEARRAPEISWISEGIASLPIERWVIEHPDSGTWFFKVLLIGGLRANVQVDRDDDTFVSVHRDGESIGMAHGALRDVITAIRRIV